MAKTLRGLALAVCAVVAWASVAQANWSGVYIGGAVGGGWSDGDIAYVAPFNGPFGYDAPGVTLAGHLGAQWQTGASVFGIEASFSGTDMDGSTPCDVGNGDQCLLELQSLTLVMGRVGLVRRSVLLYATAGYAKGEYDLSRLVFTSINLNPSFGTFEHEGYEIGAGVEKMLSEHLVVGVEYQHIDLGDDKTNAVRNDGAFATFRNEADLDRVQVRASFLF